jgi:ATP-binding cassette subfamily B protein
MRIFAPEVIQTSAMDCGPAALKCLLEAFGISVSYGRLREACQTDVDGTSIDTIEEIAKQLGLDAEQVMIPPDHLLEPAAGALPALVVTRMPDGFTHFVVAWRRHGNLVQTMDPATGRTWLRREEFLRRLFTHQMAVSAVAWLEWARSDAFIDVTARRLRRLGIDPKDALAAAQAAPDWLGFATLDAAARLVDSLHRAGAVRRGRQAAELLRTALADPSIIDDAHWSAVPGPPAEDGSEQVILRGAVLVRILGRKPAATELPADLDAALREPPAQPLRALLRMMRADGLAHPLTLSLGLLFVAAGVVIEALLFRSLFGVGRSLALVHQRLAGMGGILAFLGALVALELPIALGVAGMGRRLEARLRIAFLSKIPRLGDRYFASRPTSDMAERAHLVHALRTLPHIGQQLLYPSLELMLTTFGLAWLDPKHALVALIAALLGVLLPWALTPPLTERDLRVRVHDGSLMRFYLDGLIGLVAVRAHGAERNLRREHESLLTEWARASQSLLRTAIVIEGLQALVGFGLAAWLLMSYLGRGDSAGALLLVYWALNLPALGQSIALAARQYPMARNLALRLYEPLGAREDEPASTAAPAVVEDSAGAHLSFAGVGVRAGGHTILDGIDLELEPGTHVAVVGTSGAGKSSLVGLLLGWHRPYVGEVRVDGQPLVGAHLAATRLQTAWVDPAVHLWNRSFVDNLRNGADAPGPVDVLLDAAELRGVLEHLPEGMQTLLGEGGGLVSGGEGQRVRFARALARRSARLVILDEPFRGLDRERRRRLYSRARAWWPNATLICVMHDVAETMEFPRVLVIEEGRIAEDGAPSDLALQPTRYRRLLEADAAIVGKLRGGAFRQVRLEDGQLHDEVERG